MDPEDIISGFTALAVEDLAYESEVKSLNVQEEPETYKEKTPVKTRPQINNASKTRFNVPVDLPMVSEPGENLRPRLSEWISFVPRFPIHKMSMHEIERQMRDIDRWVACVNLPDVDLSSEESVDKWFDKVANVVRKHNLCEDVYIHVVSVNLPAREGELFEDLPSKGYEKRVADFILELFSASEYASKLEEALHAPVRMTNATAAFAHVRAKVTAYMRACNRRGRTMSLTVERMTEFALGSLPQYLHEHIDVKDSYPNGWPSLKILSQVAIRAELILNRHTKHKTQEYGFPVANDRALAMVPIPEIPQYNPRKIPEKVEASVPCTSCGDIHFIKDCPYKTHRCELCYQLGHLEKMCVSTVIKSPDGKLELILLPKPGSTVFRLFKDRTQEQRLSTATQVIQSMLDATRQKNERGRDRRWEQKSRNRNKQGPERKRRRSFLACKSGDVVLTSREDPKDSKDPMSGEGSGED